MDITSIIVEPKKEEKKDEDNQLAAKEDKEEEAEEDLEQDLLDSLSLIEEMNGLLEAVLAYRHKRKLYTHMFDEIFRLAQESSVFLATHDSDVKWDEDKKDDKDDLINGNFWD